MSLPPFPPHHQALAVIQRPFVADEDAVDFPALVAARCAITVDHARIVCELAQIGGRQ